MAMVVSLYETLEKIGKKRRTDEKVQALRQYDSVPLRIILQGAFDPNVQWMLPEGIPPYTPNKLVDQEHVLIREAEKIRYFVKGFYDNLPQAKREMLFVEMLERVSEKDAVLLCSIKDKKLPFPGITAEQIIEALPGLLPENVKYPQLKNNYYSPKGKKWYYNPEDNTEQQFEEGTQPENWVKGRLPKNDE